MTVAEPTLATTAIEAQVASFYGRYLGALNRGDLAAWPAAFLEDGCYRVSSAENVLAGWDVDLVLCETKGMIEDRLYSLQNACTFEPRLIRRIASNFQVVEMTDHWDVRADFIATQARLDQPISIFAAGYFEDKVVSTDGEIKFLQHRCVCDNDLVDNSLIFPL